MDKKFLKECLKEEVYKYVYNFKGKHFVWLKKLKAKIGFKLLSPMYYDLMATLYLRKMQYHRSASKGKHNRLFHKLRAIHYFNLLNKKYSCHFALDCQIGKGLLLRHPSGIVIANGVVIGENCTIYHKTTIGVKNSTNWSAPKIGNNCIIYNNTSVIGAITVADNVVIGCNSCLLHDALEAGSYVGSPAKRVVKN